MYVKYNQNSALWLSEEMQKAMHVSYASRKRNPGISEILEDSHWTMLGKWQSFYLHWINW